MSSEPEVLILSGDEDNPTPHVSENNIERRESPEKKQHLEDNSYFNTTQTNYDFSALHHELDDSSQPQVVVFDPPEDPEEGRSTNLATKEFEENENNITIQSDDSMDENNNNNNDVTTTATQLADQTNQEESVDDSGDENDDDSGSNNEDDTKIENNGYANEDEDDSDDYDDVVSSDGAKMEDDGDEEEEDDDDDDDGDDGDRPEGGESSGRWAGFSGPGGRESFLERLEKKARAEAGENVNDGDGDDDDNDDQEEEGNYGDSRNDISMSEPPMHLLHDSHSTPARKPAVSQEKSDTTTTNGPSRKEDKSATAPSAKKKIPPRTPSPPPKKVLKKQPTFHLDIDLSRLGTKPLEFSIVELAKKANLYVDIMGDSDDENSGEDRMPSPGQQQKALVAPILAPPPAKPNKRKRRIQDRDEGYDVNDPFVDDSELTLDAPKFYVRPEQEGFYIATGKLKLHEKLKKKQQSAPDSKRQKTGEGPNDTTNKDSGSNTPLFGANAAQKAKEQKEANTVKKQKDTAPKPISAELQEALDHFKAEADKESFENKSHFPDRLRPLITTTAIKAYELGEYNENYYNHLPKILPYNRFTLRKLTKRDFFVSHIGFLRQKQDLVLSELGGAISEAMTPLLKKYENDVRVYEEKKKKDASSSTTNVGSSNTPNSGNQQTSTDNVRPSSAPENGVNGEQSTPNTPVDGADTEDNKDNKNNENSEPVKKFVWTIEIRKLVYDAVIIEDEMTALKNEKAEFEKDPTRITDLSAHKQLYARMVKKWPEGWMQSNDLSRAMSTARKRIERDSAK